MESLEAYDWIRLAEQTRAQLVEARGKLDGSAGHERELRWLDEAAALASGDPEVRADLVARARRLPELATVRDEHASDLIGPWADAIERLHAGIVFHAGVRSPIIEALFPHRKFDQLRRSNLDNARAYGVELQRRLASSYLDRLLAREEFAFARPTVEEVSARYASIADSSEDAPAPEEAEALLSALAAEAESVRRALAQARLLAEAALVPVAGAFAELGLKSKPKARAAAKAKKIAEVEAKPEVAPAPVPEAPVAKKRAKAKAAPPAKAQKPAKAAKKPRRSDRKPEASA